MPNMNFSSWLDELPDSESPAAKRWNHRLHGVIVVAVLLTIPAFYLESGGPVLLHWRAGALLYGLSSVSLLSVLVSLMRLSTDRFQFVRRHVLDLLIALGGLISLTGSFGDWNESEWMLRLLLVVITFLRLLLLAKRFFSPSGTIYLLGLSMVTLGLAGAGFYWLEPTVHSYADGLWLAFVTGATVGYGDVVPTTPISRIFAVFMVLLGYALLSLVTASIAAVFVGEDEKKLRREVHRDMKLLRDEVRALRAELHAHRTTPRGTKESNRGARG